MAKRRFSSNAFELGIFSSNVQNGMAQFKTEIWDASWEHNLKLAQLADEAGLEFMLPLGRWRAEIRNVPRFAPEAYGAFETLTWAAGLLAATERSDHHRGVLSGRRTRRFRHGVRLFEQRFCFR